MYTAKDVRQPARDHDESIAMHWSQQQLNERLRARIAVFSSILGNGKTPAKVAKPDNNLGGGEDGQVIFYERDSWDWKRRISSCRGM